MAQMIFAPSLYVDFFKLGWYNSSIQKLPAFSACNCTADSMFPPTGRDCW